MLTRPSVGDIEKAAEYTSVEFNGAFQTGDKFENHQLVDSSESPGTGLVYLRSLYRWGEKSFKDSWEEEENPAKSLKKEQPVGGGRHTKEWYPGSQVKQIFWKEKTSVFYFFNLDTCEMKVL